MKEQRHAAQTIAETPRFRSVLEVAQKLKPDLPVYCLHVDTLKAAARQFVDHFPGRTLYAVKCNFHPLVLQALYQGGIRHFDTASLEEIEQVKALFPDATCYFMHPIKSRNAIRKAYFDYDIRYFVIDHAQELEKLRDIIPAQDAAKTVVFVRMATPPFGAAYELSEKFGVDIHQTAELLKQAHGMGFSLGVAFHVGSNCHNPQAWEIATLMADEAIGLANVPVHYLDVGGGFAVNYPGEKEVNLDDYFQIIRDSLKKARHLDSTKVQLLCEPGRALVAHGCSVLAQVYSRKDDKLYINDGIYHNLSEAITAQLQFAMTVLPVDRTPSQETQEFTIYGPTCDSKDILPYYPQLPVDTKEGDFIQIHSVGAYSNALTTQFNGFFSNDFVEIDG